MFALFFFNKSNEIFNENGRIRQRTKFDTTYKMSTYLAAWFIAPLDYISKNISSKNNLTVNIKKNISKFKFSV